jgi:hypothetical protein
MCFPTEGMAVLIRLEDCVVDTFRPYVGTNFSFRCPEPLGAIVRLTLQEVRCGPSAPAEHPGAPAMVRRGGFFSLFFVVKAETPPASGLYRLDHPDFEPFSLLLSRLSVPWGRPDDPPLFEAVFG